MPLSATNIYTKEICQKRPYKRAALDNIKKAIDFESLGV